LNPDFELQPVAGKKTPVTAHDGIQHEQSLTVTAGIVQIDSAAS
jgi:hypothetical protein